MNKQAIIKSIEELRKNSKKRKFQQTFDLIINLKNLNLKKPDQNLDIFLVLPHSRGKKVKICSFVGTELSTKAKAISDKIILNTDFNKYTNKKELKRIGRKYDYFVAQANLMGQIAQTFGKTLGPLGKMPNPKAGCIVTPTADISGIKNKLQKTIQLKTKNEPCLKSSIGIESMKDEEIAENIYSVYNNIIHLLPQEKANLKSVEIKLTMGPIVKITDKGPELKIKEKKKKQPKQSTKKAVKKEKVENKEEKPKEEAKEEKKE